MAVDVFSVPVFLVVFREALETVIIVSVLLAFLKQTLGGPDSDSKTYKDLRRQVWLGTGLGFLICLIVAGALIGVFYRLGSNTWEKNEYWYEGAFCLFATIIITIMGAALLRIGKMQSKWRVKLGKALDAPITQRGSGGFKRFVEKYAMFVLPFVTVLREGIEAIVFVTGVTFSAPAQSVPLAVVIGLLVGIIIGYLLYKGGSTAKIQVFLVLSTCLLYLVAAGLFSRAVWAFETGMWNKALGGEIDELGNGPGSYDIQQSVWHVNCCGTGGGSGWGFFNAILGWTNSATYGSIISYNLYWLFVMAMFITMRFKEIKGHWPLMKAKAAPAEDSGSMSESSGQSAGDSKQAVQEKTVATA